MFILTIYSGGKTFCFFINNKCLFLIALHVATSNVYSSKDIMILVNGYLQGDQVSTDFRRFSVIISLMIRVTKFIVIFQTSNSVLCDLYIILHKKIVWHTHLQKN